MIRSPLFLPLNRGMDMEGGGAADLQTDVMRFMAILSLCLVAIFALVQSIPLTPVADQVTRPRNVNVERQAPETTSREPSQVTQRKKFVLTRPEAANIQVREDPVLLQRPIVSPLEKNQPLESQPRPVPTAVPQQTTTERTASSKPRIGFTLRFESDSALTRLVEQNTVGLFAIAGDRSLRLDISSGRMSFWTASTPNQVHEMDVATVPRSVLDAYARNKDKGEPAVKWGVSIPPAMSRQLKQFLSKHEGGSLIIGASGRLRLEQ